MISLRVRSRDGLERVTIENPHTTSVCQLKALIQSQLGVPFDHQILSTDRNLLLAKTHHDLANFADMSGTAEATTLATLGLSHGSFVFLLYPGERTVAAPGPTCSPAHSFGRVMTVADLAAIPINKDAKTRPRSGISGCWPDAVGAECGRTVMEQSILDGQFEKMGLND